MDVHAADGAAAEDDAASRRAARALAPVLSIIAGVICFLACLDWTTSSKTVAGGASGAGGGERPVMVVGRPWFARVFCFQLRSLT